jgi:hypothetical protein
MLRFLRLRYLLLYAILIAAYSYVDLQSIVRGPLTRAINNHLAAHGFAEPRYDITTLSLTQLVLENIQLDPQGINTIDRVEARFTPWGLAWHRRLDDLIITRPDLIFGLDQLTNPPATPRGASSFSLASLPTDDLTIRDLSLSLATGTVNPSIAGDVTLASTTNGEQTLLFNLSGSQKDFSLSLKGRITEDSNRAMSINIDVPEARFDIPGILMMARARANIDLSIRPNTPIAAKGELVAGAMRIGILPLDNVSLVASGSKPDFSLIGNAGITGMPMTNISLRLTEDRDQASMLVQLSGDNPQKLAQTLIPKGGPNLGTSQKYVAAIDMKDTSLVDLISAPYGAGIFIYDDKPKPFLKAALNCPTGPADCQIQLPDTQLVATSINAFIGPMLADYGLEWTRGTATVSGTFNAPFNAPQWRASATIKDATLNWQGLDIEQLATTFVRGEKGAINVGATQAGVLGGKLSTTALSITPEGNGTTTATFRNLDLAELGRFVRIDGLDLTGTASGTLPISLERFTPTIKKGGTLSGSKGLIQYRPGQYPGFLGGDDERMGVLRQSLENYRFDSLTLDFSGDPMGDVTATLAAKGRNEKLFGTRPIHINLKIDGPLAPAIKQLLPYLGGGQGTTP